MSDLTSDLRRQLVCPECGGDLADQASRPALECPRCAKSFPVIDGIPRFVADEHLASFGLQWNRYEVAHEDEDRATFQAKTGLALDQLAGLRVLDAGCGGGRYSQLVGRAGADVVAADHSAAVDKAAQLCRELPNVGFVQADLKRLPLRPASFDVVFSIGVMHHDEKTRAVFDAVAAMVKPGGKLAVWLYRRNQWWQEWLNNRLRRRTVRMSPGQLERWSKRGAWLGGLPIVNRTLNKIVNFSSHPRRENRICDTFDWYAPRFQHHHTVDELTHWFRAAGYRDLVVLQPEKRGRMYRWLYRRNLLIGSGVNILGTRSEQPA